MNLARAIATVGGYTMISRVTGFVRDMLIAAVVGAGPIADAFFVAFQIPNFFRRLTGEGALTVAFVPMFAGMVETRSQEAAVAFAGQVQSVLLLVLLILLAVAEIAMPGVILLLAPGFGGDDPRYDLAVELTRITFPYLPLISLVALWGGMLNSLGKFWAMAAAPILLNLILIAALTLAAGVLETPGHVLAWGVTVAGAAQALFVAVACRREGALPPLVRPRLTPEVKRLLVLIGPAALGAGVVQVNAFIGILLASLLPAGSVSYLYYADRVVQLPLGVVGVAIGTALLPMLSRQVRAGEKGAAIWTQNRALEIGLLLTVPAAFAISVIADPLITVLFQRGAFSATDGFETAITLAAYAAGLPAFVLIKVFQPGFFARQDTATPVKVAAAAVVANLACNAVLLPMFDQVGIALSTVISSWLNAALLATLLYRRGHLALDKRLLVRAPKIVLAACLMAAALWFLAGWLAPWLAGATVERVGALAGLVIAGLAVYAAACLILKAAHPRDFAAMRRAG
ncbi:murein biosynthesis integral membrane protein MurJ [Thalassobaculum sp. OXR-137]|uniref:murein biosynthesis integral membrane protein MurJ n=1 Tax=Thalassobaculum sp. OXR-137 TaxID=3100173 RepID=UPI002AC8B0AE|nr:murein biosynthesis integral membrane protein MurJ [Thalassobaculum sp. OXR-137]WPZ35579.1 murein biosynthesis integral membrane protein MurJ [Thalassobaculum sp. OXR-137]